MACFFIWSIGNNFISFWVYVHVASGVIIAQ